MLTHQASPRALFICGSLNQTTQLHAVATQLPECRAFFTPFYATGVVNLPRHAGLFENTILGNKLRQRCLDYLEQHELAIDLFGRNGPYDLVVTCTDLFIPSNLQGAKLVVVQEGMFDRESVLSRVVEQLHLPLWMAGNTSLSGRSGRYDRMCLASEGYRDLLVEHGVPASRLYVTGIPNFDDCARYANNMLPVRGYVLVCTSDLREMYQRDRRARFLVKAARIAAGRPLHFKFHPNEDAARAAREVAMYCPRATIHWRERTEELIANCAALVTQISSVTFVGLALGKEVHSLLDLAELRRLMPLQNGGRSAENIAELCRELLPRERAVVRWRCFPHEAAS